MKERPLEEEIHARLRQLTSEVRALRQDLEGSLRKSSKRAMRGLNVRRPSSSDDRQPPPKK